MGLTLYMKNFYGLKLLNPNSAGLLDVAGVREGGTMCPPSRIAINQPISTLFSPNFCITAITIALASTFHEKIRKNGDLGLKMTIFVIAPLVAETR